MSPLSYLSALTTNPVELRARRGSCRFGPPGSWACSRHKESTPRGNALLSIAMSRVKTGRKNSGRSQADSAPPADTPSPPRFVGVDLHKKPFQNRDWLRVREVPVPVLKLPLSKLPRSTSLTPKGKVSNRAVLMSPLRRFKGSLPKNFEPPTNWRLRSPATHGFCSTGRKPRGQGHGFQSDEDQGDCRGQHQDRQG